MPTKKVPITGKTKKPKHPGDDIIKYLKDNYAYEDGKVYRVRENSLTRVGKIAGGGVTNNYRYYEVLDVRVGGRKAKLRALKMHHVVWLLNTGEWPDMEIDHKNRNSLDNNFDNLRKVTSKEQAENR